MIDSHCHLEQKDYDKDRDEVIGQCKKELKAVVTSCAHPKDFDLTMQIAEKHKGFVFASAGLHPEYIKELRENEKDELLEKIKQNRKNIFAIGEIGLDYFWVKDRNWQEKQKELLAEIISFAKELKKPIVVHSRDCGEDAIKILEQEDAKQVLLHLFGSRQQMERVIQNSWLISIGPIIARSKNHKKIARDFPLENILLETDSPWFGGSDPKGKPVRGTPLNIKIPAEKIAEEKKMPFGQVWKQCGKNAVKFFGLPIEI
ncbi:MAG: TatD family hydrolase [Candidatus Aenigmatarchaeota archaeon]